MSMDETVATESTAKRFATTADVFAGFALLLSAIVLYAPILFGGKTLFFRDIPVAAYPMKHFLYRAFHDGQIPFWNPQIYNGLPFMATLHPGVFYPPSLIFFMDDFVTAFNLTFVLHHLLLAFSVYALVRYWGLSAWAAFGAALVALGGGYFLSVMNMYSHFFSAAWTPSIILFFQRFLARGGVGGFLGATACLACQTLVCSPEHVILTAFILFAWSNFGMPADGRIVGMARRVLALAAMGAAAMGIAALQLLPAYALLKESVRADGMIFADHSRWSLDPDDLFTLLVPKSFDGMMESAEPFSLSFIQSIYMGIIPAILLGFSMLRPRERAVRFWVGLFFAGIFLALGKNNPVYEFFYSGFPVLKLFRYPEKFFFLCAFSLVFLTGHGLDALMRRAPAKNLAVYAAILAAMCAAVLATDGISGGRAVLSIGFILVFGFCVSMYHLGKLRAAGLQALLALLMALDLGGAHLALVVSIDRSFYEEDPPRAKEIKREEGLFRVYSGPIQGTYDQIRFPAAPNRLASHYLLRELLRPNLGMVYDLSYPDGMEGMELRDNSLWIDIFKNSPPDKRRRILERSNVKYWVDDRNFYSDPGTEPMSRKSGVEIFEQALPRVFLVSSARVETVVNAINVYFDEKFDPLSEVLLVENPADWKKTENFAGAVEQVEYGINRVTVRTRQNGDAFLVFLDSYQPGGKVEIDGVPGRILRGNYFYRTVQLPPGEHRLQFDYEPEGYKTGLYVSFGSLAAMFVGGAALHSRGKK